MAVARVSEIVASSSKGFDDAVKEGFHRASKTLRGITGIEITKFQAKVEGNKLKEYRVHMNVTFILED
ncbi:MAG: dodecin domain-containing protein [Planctomycetes bacterium]|nr:dodecin domain-containing protein [Planctomycetota bacterium]